MEKMDIYKKVKNADGDLSILSLPVHINVGERLSTVMTKRLNDYYDLLQKGTSQMDLHQMWPIIASCYCLSFWCDHMNKQCNSERQYMEEYKFPQMISRCFREMGDTDGIRYFTVRDEDLNPNEQEMVDYIFFTKNYDAHGIDRELRDKFCITIVE